MNELNTQELPSLVDEQRNSFTFVNYEGEQMEMTVDGGVIIHAGKRYFISDNLPNGTTLTVLILKGRQQYDSLIIQDILSFGRTDLRPVVYRCRFTLLYILLQSLPNFYQFRLTGCRAISPYVYCLEHIENLVKHKTHDKRVSGFVVIDGISTTFSKVNTIPFKEDDEDVDRVDKYPPVLDEAKRVLGYQNMVWSMIQKMRCRWKDCYMKKHSPGQLPFDADDLLQQGLMEVTVALRKYIGGHESGAKEATFVYKHLWNRFGQIAHKWSKPSKGYGAVLLRMIEDEDGNLLDPCDLKALEDDER